MNEDLFYTKILKAFIIFCLGLGFTNHNHDTKTRQIYPQQFSFQSTLKENETDLVAFCIHPETKLMLCHCQTCHHLAQASANKTRKKNVN